MRQGSEVRWILLACAVLNCLGILLSAGEYRGMVSDGIYDALISAGSDPNIQLESLRGYQFRWLLHGHGAVVFFLGFLLGNREVTRVSCLVFSALGALWLSTPLWFPVQGVQISVWFLIAAAYLVGVAYLWWKYRKDRREQSDFHSKI